jgi:hypothetical protein
MKKRWALLAGFSSCYIFLANHFIGDWKGDVEVYGETVTVSLPFAEDMSLTVSQEVPGYGTFEFSGTYDYTDTTLTVSPEGGSEDTMGYDFSDLYRTLTLDPTADSPWEAALVLERQQPRAFGVPGSAPHPESAYAFLGGRIDLFPVASRAHLYLCSAERREEVPKVRHFTCALQRPHLLPRL